MTSGVPGHDGKDPPRLADEIAPAVVELHGEGHGRNAIARALGVSTGTVSNAARIAGVTFDVSATQVASRTRAEQLAEDRADLAGMAAEIAKRAGRRLLIEVGATVLDPSTMSALNRVFGTGVEKAVLAGATVHDESRDEHAAARVWMEGIALQIEAAGRGLIPTDERGNFLLQQPGASPDTDDHDDPDLLED